ncbi:MAG: nuclear transport factor 2 family protein [Acidobacteriota bacterium]
MLKRTLLPSLLLVQLAMTPPAHPRDRTGQTVWEPPPILLLVQGELEPGAGAIYEQYLAGTRPLMAEYGAKVSAVGTGIESANTTDAWPINAVLEFPDRDAAEGFLADPRYLEIKEKYRDRAYRTLHLTLVESRAPRVRTARDVANDAFDAFRKGLATGQWEAFLAYLDRDFTFHFPMGPYQGEHRGWEKAKDFFHYVAQAFPDGLTIDQVYRVTAEEDRVVFEFSDHGQLRGQSYHNRVAISLDVCGEKICGYREYFGLVGPPPETKE